MSFTKENSASETLAAPTRPSTVGRAAVAGLTVFALTMSGNASEARASGQAGTEDGPSTAANSIPSVSRAQARTAAVRVHVTVRKHRITRSRNGFSPGKTVFDIRSPGGPAAIQLLRLRKGYSLADFRKDAASDSLQALRRIDRKVVFYAGLPVFKGKASHFGATLEAGHYFLFDFDTPRWVRLRVEGAPQRRYLPRTTGSVDYVLRHQNHRFKNPRRLPRSGWLRQTNRTDEPHLMELTKVKRSTTRRQVRRALAGQGPEDPKWVLREYPGSFLVSPGRSMVWRYSYPRGKYVELCFWPSKEDGTSHAEMGMWNFITLR